ncbi:MAG: hypothetical protein LBJ48_06720 [Coriobacteriales bacterium]|nr:hypothetical protein [Coriobacteriales bacterium]
MKTVERPGRQQGKRAVLTLLVCLLTLSLFPLIPVNQAEAEPLDRIERDVYIGWDISEGMAGQPHLEARAAIQNLIKALFEDDRYDTRVGVGIITSFAAWMGPFDESVHSSFDITAGFGPGNTTNLAQSITRLVEKDETAGRPGAKKILILLSGSLPSAGDLYYHENDMKYHQDTRRSAVYKYAKELLGEYDIYTIGFLGNISDYEKPKLVELLQDIQTAGYYEALNGDELNFVNEDIVRELDGLGYPIIIVPGAMGSRLYSHDKSEIKDYEDYEDYRVWDPDPNPGGVAGLSHKMAINEPLYTRPADVNLDELPAGEREYGAANIYQPLVDTLCDSFDREIYFFSYDWRKDYREAAGKLDEFIKSLGVEKVDLVCHSMGGIVASCYYKAQGHTLLNKVITCGTPYDGAPEMLRKTLTTAVLDDWRKDLALASLGGLSTEIKASFPAMAQLTPSLEYVSLFPTTLARSYNSLTQTQYLQYHSGLYSRGGTDAFKDGNKAYTDEDGLTALASYDGAYFTVGQSQRTLYSAVVNLDPSTTTMYMYDGIYLFHGDGTVPYASATDMFRLSTLGQGRFATVATDHVGTIGKPDNPATAEAAKRSLDRIVAILSLPVDEVPELVDEIVSTRFLVIRIACPVDVRIEAEGDYLSSASDDYRRLSSFGRLDPMGEAGEIKLLCLDPRTDYTISLDGTDTGTMDYEIRFFDEEGELEQRRTFESIRITEDTEILTGSDPDKDTVLAIDDDGDGKVDRSPSATANGRYMEEEVKAGDSEEDDVKPGTGPVEDNGEGPGSGVTLGTTPQIIPLTYLVESLLTNGSEQGSSSSASPVNSQQALQDSQGQQSTQTESALSATTETDPQQSEAASSLVPFVIGAVAIVAVSILVYITVLTRMRAKRRHDER